MQSTVETVGQFAQWADPRETDRNMAWARSTYSALKPFVAPTRYVNYLEEDVAGDPAARIRVKLQLICFLLRKQ